MLTTINKDPGDSNIPGRQVSCWKERSGRLVHYTFQDTVLGTKLLKLRKFYSSLISGVFFVINALLPNSM